MSIGEISKFRSRIKKMETTLQRNPQAQEHNRQAAFARGVKVGLTGGTAGTLVMELFLMGALSAAGKPALTCLSYIGDTVAHLFANFGIYLTGGVPMCLAAQYLIGALLGVIFGTLLCNVSALHINSLAKSILLAVIYVEIMSQPLLAMTTILLKMTVKETLFWYGASFVMHLLYGIVLGAIVSYGLRKAIQKVSNIENHIWRNTP
jgi:hypothetical protein